MKRKALTTPTAQRAPEKIREVITVLQGQPHTGGRHTPVTMHHLNLEPLALPHHEFQPNLPLPFAGRSTLKT